MEHKFYLISIIPNEEARLKLQSLRRRLFQTYGFASAMAFEPVIPVAWFRNPIESGHFAGFSRGFFKDAPQDDSGVKGEDITEDARQNGSGDTTGGFTKGAVQEGHRAENDNFNKKPSRVSRPMIEITEPYLLGGHIFLGVKFHPENLPLQLIQAAGRPPNGAYLVRGNGGQSGSKLVRGDGGVKQFANTLLGSGSDQDEYPARDDQLEAHNHPERNLTESPAFPPAVPSSTLPSFKQSAPSDVPQNGPMSASQPSQPSQPSQSPQSSQPAQPSHPPFPTAAGIFLAAFETGDQKTDTVRRPNSSRPNTPSNNTPAAHPTESKSSNESPDNSDLLNRIQNEISRLFAPGTILKSTRIGMYSIAWRYDDIKNDIKNDRQNKQNISEPTAAHHSNSLSEHFIEKKNTPVTSQPPPTNGLYPKGWWKHVEWKLEWKIQLKLSR